MSENLKDERSAENCIFCKIINKKIESKIIYEDDDVFCFEDINPQAPFHCLVIPKKHIPTLNDGGELDEALLGKLLLTASKVATIKGYEQTGFRTVINTEKQAGQVVWHIHLHVLAGRAMTWPPG